MGRTKQSPKKREDLYMGNCSLSGVDEFIPSHRKKRAKKRSSKDKFPTYNLIPATEEHKDHFLGEIRVGSTSNVLPQNFSFCKISFNYLEETESFDIVLSSEDDCFIVHTLEDVSFLKDFVQTKIFSFQIYAQGENVFFKVFLISIPLPKYAPKFGKCIKTAFKLFYNVDIGQESLEGISKKQSSLSNIELNDLYKRLLGKRKNMHNLTNDSLNLELLKPTLRPYQEEAVRWMIYRETLVNHLNGDIHPLYQKITLKSGVDVYIDKYTGWVEKSAPVVQGQWKGGILADEMGLGKTVEVLSLVLSNRLNKGIRLHLNKGRLEDSDSDSEAELVINTQPKKKQLVEEEEDNYIVPRKKSRISESLVKGSLSKKSATFQALQTIYNRTLSEYCTTEPREQPDECKVQCICGSAVESGLVECEDCGKWQHSTCLGWRRQLGPYKCPQCWENTEPLESGATLIVAPAALRKQWCREMRTHLKPSLKVLNYEGYSATPVYPTDLQDYDIVVTTYSVLQAEMRLTETGQFFNLRKQRKYWPGGSPLIRIKWWRLCLDEAQTVETPGRIVSAMAKKIPACHRWAVTGTPMAKGVTDVFGLIDYLQMEPYNDYDTWKYVLLEPYLRGNQEPMLNFLSKVLWRTSKDSVLDQINIPSQTHEMHMLEFSAVEKFFYNREHEICARDFLHIAAKFDSSLPLENMDKKDLKNLMGPLLSLRQACSDPSAVRGKGRYLSLKKNASSMKDLLEALILKNKNDCEDSVRLMVSSINGMAGIYLLMDNPEQAIKEYRKVLQLAARFSADEKEGKLTIDKLPLIHAMHNLAEVLETHSTTDHTLRDGTLREECADIEKQYIEKFMKETAAGKEACRIITDTVNQLEEDVILNHGQWYSDGFDWAALNRFEDDLIARVEVAAANANVECDLRGESTRTLLRTAYNWHLDLDELRESLFRAIDVLYDEDPDTKRIIIKDGLVGTAMDCHLRPQQQKGKKKNAKKCLVCVANVKLKEYEAKLFSIQRRAAFCEEMGLLGSWTPRFEEILLKALLGLLKSRNSKPDLIKDGETHILVIETLKKEFKEIRKLWTLLDRQVCARDELDICKVRLQLKTGDESIDKANRALKNLSYEQAVAHENINLIRPSELPHQELILRSEESRNSMRLEALLGTRNYLGTLRQQQFEGYTPDPCPVCRGALVNTWAILPCAHTFCLVCFQSLLNKAVLFIQCCVCRAKQNLQDVAYIKSGAAAGPHDSASDDDIPVLGNYSRKIEDVVRVLLKLRKKDSHVKVLLFSTWALVLKLLKKALEQNDIRVELAEATNLFEKRIENFKDPLKKITVLLLPVRLGAKGLNLIEATHVILLEPLLNPADELQAIGRVHRIGQTKPTVVHKFLVRNTVEESLHDATSSNAASWEKGRLTVQQVKDLFKCTNVKDEGEGMGETEEAEMTNGGCEREIEASALVEKEEIHEACEGQDVELAPKTKGTLEGRHLVNIIQSCSNKMEVESPEIIEQGNDCYEDDAQQDALEGNVQEIKPGETEEAEMTNGECEREVEASALVEKEEIYEAYEVQDVELAPETKGTLEGRQLVNNIQSCSNKMEVESPEIIEQGNDCYEDDVQQDALEDDVQEIKPGETEEAEITNGGYEREIEASPLVENEIHEACKVQEVLKDVELAPKTKETLEKRHLVNNIQSCSYKMEVESPEILEQGNACYADALEDDVQEVKPNMQQDQVDDDTLDVDTVLAIGGQSCNSSTVCEVQKMEQGLKQVQTFSDGNVGTPVINGESSCRDNEIEMEPSEELVSDRRSCLNGTQQNHELIEV